MVSPSASKLQQILSWQWAMAHPAQVSMTTKKLQSLDPGQRVALLVKERNPASIRGHQRPIMLGQAPMILMYLFLMKVIVGQETQGSVLNSALLLVKGKTIQVQVLIAIRRRLITITRTALAVQHVKAKAKISA